MVIIMINKFLHFACIVATCFWLRKVTSEWFKSDSEKEAANGDQERIFRLRREVFLRHLIYNMAFETWTKIVHSRLYIWNAKIAWFIETFSRFVVQILICFLNDVN